MSNEELNRRLRFFSDNGLPDNERVWMLLRFAWRQGCAQGNDGANAFDDNPFRDGATEELNVFSLEKP